MSSQSSEPTGSWSESMDDDDYEFEDIFETVNKLNKTPVIVLPLPDGRAIDVWTFLSALSEVMDVGDENTAWEMLQWLGRVIYDAIESIPKSEKFDKKTIAQIYRKETENFDERFEQFLKSLEDGNGQAD